MNDPADRRIVTIRDAAVASGIDRRALTRQLNDGAFPNAFRERSAEGVAKGPWLIPVDDLVAAGIALDEPRVGNHNGTTPSKEQSSVGPSATELRAELDAVRAELAEERGRRRVAEALAEERATAIETLRDALKTMEALAAAASAPAPPPPEVEPAPKPAVTEEPRRQRLRGQWLR